MSAFAVALVFNKHPSRWHRFRADTSNINKLTFAVAIFLMILLIVNIVHKFHDSYKYYIVELYRKSL